MSAWYNIVYMLGCLLLLWKFSFFWNLNNIPCVGNGWMGLLAGADTAASVGSSSGRQRQSAVVYFLLAFRDVAHGLLSRPAWFSSMVGPL